MEEVRQKAALRLPLYADVEELLNPGFLSVSASVGSIKLSMKSLSPGELTVLKSRLYGIKRDKLWRSWVVASSVWMVDGQILLGDMNAPVRLYDSIKNLSVHAVDLLFETFTVLHNKVRTAMSRLEAYCYEDYSRSSWKMYGRRSPSSPGLCSIPGADSYGMSNAQKLWVAYNTSEDERVEWMSTWTAAKLTASAHSPKGIKKIARKDETDKNLEDERRASVIEEMVLEATGQEILSDKSKRFKKAVTREDLEEEMERWVRGEKDFHDEVVEEYKNKIRAAMAVSFVAPSPQGEEAEEYHPGFTVLTPEQTRDMDSGFKTVYSDGAYGRHRLYDKFLKEEPVASVYDDTTGRSIPIKNINKRLEDDLAERKFVLKDD